MADLLVTDLLNPECWGPAKQLLRSLHPGELDRVSEMFALVSVGGDGDRPAVAAVCSPGYADISELLALATRPDRRGCGLGTRLLDGLADSLRAVGQERLVAVDHGGYGSAWLLARGFCRTRAGTVELIL